jgi:hypothetical protein
MRPAVLFSITCALCATAPTVSAQLYKWVDNGGIVNYGDWPPDGVKVQAVNGGTLSSVSDRALVGPHAFAPDALRGAPRTAGPMVNVRDEVSPSTASALRSDADVVGADAPYYGYAWRAGAAAVAGETGRPANTPIVKPLLPIDPAIPDMAWRPSRTR